MYTTLKAESVFGLLTPGCAPRLPLYSTASGSFPTATFRQVDATRVGPAACVVRIQDHTYCGPQRTTPKSQLERPALLSN